MVGAKRAMQEASRKNQAASDKAKGIDRTRLAREAAALAVEKFNAEQKPKGCAGWNFHVFTLGADQCSICQKTRKEIDAERRK